MESSHLGMHQLNNRFYNMKNTDEVEEEQRDSLLKSIEYMIIHLPPVDEECSIYRVPQRLHKINPMAYTPQVISIGPFHYGRKDLMAMEQLKYRFLTCYLDRIKKNIEDAIKTAQSWAGKARNCYAEPIYMNEYEFAGMLLVDGCFVVEYVIVNSGLFNRTQNKLDPSFYRALNIDLHRDMKMLENQLPFFVLQCLFDLLPEVEKKGVSFLELTRKVFIEHNELPHDVSTEKVNHLVDLLSFYYISPLDMEKRGERNLFLLPPTVTELYEAGVTVKKATNCTCLMNISFKDGVMEIPPFEISNHFETYMRNLMAYEHFSAGRMRYAIHYVAFLDGLISTENDFSLLVKEGIITNLIGGSEKEVLKLFNNLGKDVTIADDFYFYHISKVLHNHCRTRRHQWMASLKREYFNTPWALISFVAATFLILLTFLQTLFSALSLPK